MGNPMTEARMQPRRSIDRVALAAIVVAILMLIWARFEILGTGDFERLLANDGAPLPEHCDIRHLEAVTMNRWAAGVTQ
jgi:hypothetical protein